MTRPVTDRQTGATDALLESITDAFMSLDSHWRFTYVNKHAEILSRKSREQLLGITFADAFPEAMGTPFEACFRRVMATRQPEVIEAHYEPNESWVEVAVYPQEGGGLLLYSRDVTPRKRMQLLVDTQRRALEVAMEGGSLESALDVLVNAVQSLSGHKAIASILLLDEDGRHLQPVSAPSLSKTYIDAINNLEIGAKVGSCGTAAYLGETVIVEDIATDPRWEGFAHHALKENLKTCWSVPIKSANQKVIGTFAVYYREKRVPTETDIEVVDVLLRTAAMIIEREYNIRDRLRQRRVYEAALSNTPDLVYIFDLQHRFTYANEALLKMWGKTWEEAAGKTCLELGYEPWHAEMHGREIDQVAATKQPYRGEVPFTGTNGRRIYDYIFVPVLNEAGDVEAVAGTTRDVTERKENEDKIRQSQDALREADQRKDEFLATLAHELRNPLAPIRNALYIFKQHDNHSLERRAEARALIERQVEQMVRLVDDLMDVSRITRGKIELKREIITLNDVIRTAVETSQPIINERGHQLQINLPDEPIYVDGDLVRIGQVFANLLNNAAKYTPAKGWIMLSTTIVDGNVVVSIEDNGIGIAPDMLPQVFDMFRQADHSIGRAQGGLGIGLTLVKRLLELHGGHIEAQSMGLGKGSAFHVTLPMTSAPVVATVAANDDANLSMQRVLVVDDNEAAGKTMGWGVELFGCTAKVVHNGRAAIAMAADYKPDIVLLDIGMPDMNGYELCQCLRQMPELKNTIFVAQTGWGQEEHRKWSKEAGFHHHLVKPVNLDDLKAIVTGTYKGDDRRAS